MNAANSLLEARERLAPTKLFCVGYEWNDPIFGKLEGSTVVDSIDGTVALAAFKSRRQNVTRAWLIPGGGQ